ncbi:MAG: hypothetical protein V5A72_03010 [Candidatus Nanohaloarchaea archaeon]
MSKGSVAYMIGYIAPFILSLMLLGAGLDSATSLDEKIRLETTGITSERISNSIKSLNQMDKGKAELELGDKYGFFKDGGKTYINYSVGSLSLSVLNNESVTEIGNSESFHLDEEGRANVTCLIKEKDVQTRMELGACWS